MTIKTFILLLVLLSANYLAEGQEVTNQNQKMKIEIWSDIMCPFCYIGKRQLEKAIEKFEAPNDLEIEWKSFQLDPSITAEPGVDVYTYLAKRKGWSLDYTKKVHQQVVDYASSVGLKYNFDIAKVANSFDAHRLIQYAKSKGFGDAAEEKLFMSYFTEGKDVGNHQVLAQLGEEIGLNKAETLRMLDSNEFSDAVKRDIQEANDLEISGVPYFIIDRKYSVSGAQSSEVFLETLKKAYADWKKGNSNSDNQTIDGKSCAPEKECK